MLIDSIENKQKILSEFLKICPFSGWNDFALKEAIIAAGIEVKFIKLIFKNGAADLADFFIKENDRQMIEQLTALNLDSMRVRDKIKSALQIRLSLFAPNKTAIKRLINFYSAPKNLRRAFKNIYKTADLIWYQIGDKSTDYNFYSKRIILSKIYISSLKFFLDDSSEDNQKTWLFLDKEIAKIMKFEVFKTKIKTGLQDLSNKSVKDLLKKLPFLRLFI